MSYVVTARKWRPMVFEDIVGQHHVSTTLRNAIAANRLSHSYIFSGPRGVGKTTTARILAKAINCLHPKENDPDNTCELCREITEGRSVNVFEIDGASNRGVDEIRNLREAVRYGPAKGKYKVYIIDEVHMLTKEAFNALLKTLEEPPAYVVFIFATTEIHKVPLTILSRCQRFDFRRIPIEDIVKRLRFIAAEDKITIDDDALLIIAKRADGSLRDAQSIFDQVVSFSGESITGKDVLGMLNIVDQEMYFRITGIITSKDVKAGLELINEIMACGYDIREFLGGLSEHFRNMLVVLAAGSTKLIEAPEIFKKRYEEASPAFSQTDLLRLIKIAMETDASLRWSQQPRLRLELGLVQMIKLDSSIEIGKLIQQLDDLKKKLNGAPNPAKQSSAADETPQEAPLRGNVKATQPSLRPEQVVHSARGVVNEPLSPPRILIPIREPQQQAAEPAAEQAPTVLSQDEIVTKWSSLIDAARKERIAVGTMLSESKLLEVQGNSMRIGCPDDFHLDELKRNRQFLTDIAQRIYGARIHLDTILAQQHQQSLQAPPANGTKAETRPANGNGKETAPRNGEDSAPERHRIIETLINEFDAREIG